MDPMGMFADRIRCTDADVKRMGMDKTSNTSLPPQSVFSRQLSPMMVMLVKFSRALSLLPILALLGGCQFAVLNPAGDIAVQQRDLIIISVVLMLLIIVPVMIATVVFARRYRASNTDAPYDPNWHHSTQLEVLIWTAPLLIIIALGAVTWMSTHLLDPFRPLGRLDAERQIPGNVAPLEVQVVALDWKWMFIYPEQGIATINELAAPVDRPIRFHLTSSTVMNTFSVPALAGMIYTMAGMETQLNAVSNREGVFQGMSANYSGHGFSKMTFKFHSLNQGAFDGWVAKVKAEGSNLDNAVYGEVEKPSEGVPVRYFSSVQDGLFRQIVNLCATPGKMCMNEMMHIDAQGGAGTDSAHNRERLIYDGHRSHDGHEESGATFPASGREPRSEEAPEGSQPDELAPNVNQPQTQPTDGQDQQVPSGGQGSPAPDQLNQSN
jgi:cytochrome o ubiquinol oxidase subunit II